MDFSERPATLPYCPECCTPVGGLHKPGCDVERCTACGQQKLTCGCDSGHTVWTGEWPGTSQGAALTGVVGCIVMLEFSLAHRHMDGERHRHLDELVADVVTMFGSDRCKFDGVQTDDEEVGFVFFVEPDKVPTEARFADLSQRYGPFVFWLTTHCESNDDDGPVSWLIGDLTDMY